MTSIDLRRRLKDRLLSLPPRAFELFAGELLTFMGLRDVTVTRYIGDGGIDAHGSLETSASLVSIRAGVQVKRQRANIQRAEIDRFIGALLGQYAQGIYITTASYSPQAERKAGTSFPPIATIGGDQVAALMLRHRLGVLHDEASQLDDAYFVQFEQLASTPRRVRETPATYGAAIPQPDAALAEDDLISLRALSYLLRVDTTTVNRWVERGKLQPDRAVADAGRGLFFRRDRVADIGRDLVRAAAPESAEAWRQALLDFASGHNLTRSYKPVLLKALLATVDPAGEAAIERVAAVFRAFYLARRTAALAAEFGPPDPSDAAMSDAAMRRLIVRYPLDRMIIKGFVSYAPETGTIRFAPHLWAELRAGELIEIARQADAQLVYYYGRGAP